MSFFVVERGRAEGELLLPVPRAFETREAALEALSAAVAAGSAVIGGEVFVVDLDAAVPVLVMPTVSPASAGRVDAPVEIVADQVPAEVRPGDEAAVYDAWAEAVVSSEDSADTDLAGALKRAASSLEAEGIVAPASIEAAPAADGWSTGAPTSVVEPAGQTGPMDDEPGVAVSAADQDDPATDGAMTDLSAALAGLASAELPGEASEAPVTEALSSPDTAGSWPWTNVAPVPADDEGAAADASPDLVAETVASLDADSAAEVTMLTPVSDGEAAYLPRPVILGDYDAVSTVSSSDDVSALVGSDEDAVLEYVPQPPADPAAGSGDVTEPSVEASAGAWLDSGAATATAADTAAPGYGAGAEPELDLGAYTCDDCVYSNTCPKVGQATPAECGSFQWRTE